MITIKETFSITEKLIFDALILTQQLNEQLHLEATALKKRQLSDSIETIAVSKKLLVSKLEQIHHQLSRILATENLPNNPQGLTDYFHRARTAQLAVAKTEKNWQSIQFISAESKTLNEQNGASLDLLARHTQRSLQILKGKSPITTTYGPDGASKSDTYTRTLVLA
jgi:flagella synthesis protein FlgN